MDNSRRLRSVAVGGAAGMLAAAAWGATVWLAPPVPGNAVLATMAVSTATATAGWLRRGRSGIVAALTAGFVGSWVIVGAVDAMMPRVPDRWVPTIVTVAMNPAANVRESRIETVDPYVALLFLGALMGIALVVALVPVLHRRLLTWLVPPVHPAPVPQAVSPSRSGGHR